METIKTQDYGLWRPFTEPHIEHGTMVASMIAGAEQGVCATGKVTLIRFPSPGSFYKWGKSADGSKHHGVGFMLNKLEIMVLALQDIASKGRRGKAVVNLSIAFSRDAPQRLLECMKALLTELDKLDTVIVVASGNDFDNEDPNHRPAMDIYPPLFASDIPNMINVGAISQFSRAALFSRSGPELTVYAPGKNVQVAVPGGGIEGGDGTSFASPAVAGLVAYFRALPMPINGEGLERPANVKEVLVKMTRRVPLPNHSLSRAGFTDPNGNKFGPLVLSVWNGQLSKTVSCLVTPHAPGCPTIDFSDPTPVGELCSPNAIPRRGILEGRQALSCPLQPPPDGPGNGGGDGGGGDQGPTKTVTYSRGTPSPTCRANCGTLCTGYWCRPTQRGQPPHFTDPANISTTRRPVDPPSPTVTQRPGFPDLPPEDDWFPTSPPWGECVSSATLTSIGGPGGGGGQATITSSGCMVWATKRPDFPDIPPPDDDDWFPTSPPGATCASSATLTSVGGFGGIRDQATIISSGCMSWTTSTKPEPTPDPPKKPEYPYTWYIYATETDNPILGATSNGYMIFDSPPDCKDVSNTREMNQSGDVTGCIGPCIRCPGCTVCTHNGCGTDWSDWWSISVLEIKTPSTHVTWYADRDGALVNTRNIQGGRCEMDTSDDFQCQIPFQVTGIRQLKCHALFSRDSIFE
ncbi:Peptidase S8/S53 domain containing protein [Rhypophila decipiens]